MWRLFDMYTAGLVVITVPVASRPTDDVVVGLGTAMIAVYCLNQSLNSASDTAGPLFIACTHSSSWRYSLGASCEL